MEANQNTGAQMPGMAQIVERNITALLERRKAEESKNTKEQKLADGITGFAGSMLFVYIHLTLFGLWVIWNLGWIGLKPFDPSFVVLAMFASVEAIFLSTFVLISQNRANAQADRRADLDLQVSLLAEHEITRIVSLVTAIAKKMDIDDAHHPELNELAQDIKPENVMDVMDKHKEQADNTKSSK
ncbi:DUF1003 domain-containing protein [Mucilaginibacter sp. Bleaf8]|uniref:DUF1003 domain-containing protein n=1 Tax=Mucilaginibacter sp. Bleaf8 TaxID=2834430 RepID=UPI001BCB03A8|nr:DUF1003 domain-containing protein [Mucilaginibacter sp. Bleaf8]MBS7565009.1 DUF1003 domain-containing protein [Mucilaginibacter sp. Bleaf8]